MKKIRFSFFLSFSATTFFAQPVITSGDLLKVGDVVTTQPCATTTFTPGAAGANQTWDFSQLIPEGPEDTTFYILPAGTPYAANYPSSNIAGRFGEGYGYYQVTGDKLLFWGQTDPSSALVLSDPAVYFKSPTTYGTFVLDTIAGTLNAGPLSGSVTGQVFYSGDGYGTLLLPGGQQYSDVLRIKTATVGVATVPFLGTITDSVFNYSWYKLGVKSPVLEMIEDTQWSGGAVISQTRYVNYFRSITSGAAEPGGAPGIRVFPNPADDQVRFSGLENPARVVIRNTAGQRMLDVTLDPNEPVSVANLEPGVYICSLYGGSDQARFVKLMIR